MSYKSMRRAIYSLCLIVVMTACQSAAVQPSQPPTPVPASPPIQLSMGSAARFTNGDSYFTIAFVERFSDLGLYTYFVTQDGEALDPVSRILEETNYEVVDDSGVMVTGTTGGENYDLLISIDPDSEWTWNGWYETVALPAYVTGHLELKEGEVASFQRGSCGPVETARIEFVSYNPYVFTLKVDGEELQLDLEKLSSPSADIFQGKDGFYIHANLWFDDEVPVITLVWNKLHWEGMMGELPEYC